MAVSLEEAAHLPGTPVPEPRTVPAPEIAISTPSPLVPERQPGALRQEIELPHGPPAQQHPVRTMLQHLAETTQPPPLAHTAALRHRVLQLLHLALGPICLLPLVER